jgi:DNA/RNA-binding domain of Phe-tRNA-synthetase-like protein
MNRQVALPEGRVVELGPDVAEKLLCGVLAVDGVRIAASEAVAGETAELAAELRTEHTGKTPAEIPALQEARRLYRSAGMDPTRTRPSSEALLRRVLKGKSLYRINNAVDSCNLASLSFLLPIGMYDLDRIEGSVTLRLGRPGEEYPGIRKGPVHLTGRLGLFDVQGPFGSPTSDSARTCVRETTERLLAVIMATGSYPPGAMTGHVGLLADLLVRHCQAAVLLQGLLPDRKVDA